MRLLRWPLVVLTTLVLLAPLAPVRAEPPAGDIRDINGAWPEGQGFCFQRQMVFGPIVIQGGRCYNFYVIRTDGRGFLGFGPSGPTLVPPGQIIRLDTAERLRSLFYYLIPLPVIPVTIPVNAAQLVNVQVVGQAGRLVILVPRGAVGAARPVEVGFAQP